MKKINNKLFAVALGGLWACTGMVYLFNNEVSKTILKSSVTQEALEILRQHGVALNYLGEPIKELKANFTNSFLENKTNRNIEVHISGPKSKGILFISAVSDQNQKFSLDTIQLQIGKDDSKRLVIKNSSNENKNG